MITTGDMTNPKSGKTMILRQVMTLVGKAKHSMKFYTSAPGMPREMPMMEMMEVTYSRAGKSAAKKKENKNDAKTENQKDEKKTK